MLRSTQNLPTQSEPDNNQNSNSSSLVTQEDHRASALKLGELQNRVNNSLSLQRIENLQNRVNSSQHQTDHSLSHQFQSPIQRVPQAVQDQEGIYRDDRGGNRDLEARPNGRYKVVDDDFIVRYEPDGEQYFITLDNSVTWDPVTGDAYNVEGGGRYTSMGGDDYVYSHGHYMPVPETSAGLTGFFDEIWALRGAIGGLDAVRDRLNYIYTRVYSKSEENNKAAPVHKSPTIDALVNFSNGKNGQIQGGVIIPPDDHVFDIAYLYEMMTFEPYTEQVKFAAYRGLSRKYYYYFINDINPNTRIIINVAPTNVPGALATLWPIVNGSDLVQGMKAGGPEAAAMKLDSILIYARRDAGFDELLDAIKGAGLQTIDLLPGLAAEEDPGIGVADDPPAVGQTNISFGQKRIILSYMALARSNSQARFRTLGATYFKQAGINTESPSKELDEDHHPNIEAELGHLLAVMNGQ